MFGEHDQNHKHVYFMGIPLILDQIEMLRAQNLGNWVTIYEDMVPRHRFCAMLRTAGRQVRFLAYLGTWGQFWDILYSYESVE